MLPSAPSLPPPAPQTASSQESNEKSRGRGVSPPSLPHERRRDRRREEGALPQGLTQLQNYSWRRLAELRVGGGAGTGPAASGPGRRRRHRPCPAPRSGPLQAPGATGSHSPAPGAQTPASLDRVRGGLKADNTDSEAHLPKLRSLSPVLPLSRSMQVAQLLKNGFLISENGNRIATLPRAIARLTAANAGRCLAQNVLLFQET